MRRKYDINQIKEMRLDGMTLKEIAEFYGVKKPALTRFLKRNGVVFWKLPKKCKYCGKVFKPRQCNQQLCSKKCKYIHTLKRMYRNKKKYYRRKGIYYDHYLNNHLNRNNPEITYKDSINFLNRKKESCTCPLCGNNDVNEFEICRGEIVCNVCQLVQE